MNTTLIAGKIKKNFSEIRKFIYFELHKPMLYTIIKKHSLKIRGYCMLGRTMAKNTKSTIA